MNTIIPQQHYIEDDVLLVHKPIGISSFDVIRKLRPIFNTKKIGHAGTLDPLARGLMIVGINAGTKKMNTYLKLPKTYIAEVLIGKSTTTGDREGEVLKEVYIGKSDLKDKDVEDAVMGMVGTHTLQVPLYSAIKVQGTPLYTYARQGITPPYIPEKDMHIMSIQLLDTYHAKHVQVVKVRVEVTSGSYIRTLGEELGRRLGYPATLKSLHRTKIAEYRDTDAYHINQSPSQPKGLRGILRSLFGHS